MRRLLSLTLVAAMQAAAPPPGYSRGAVGVEASPAVAHAVFAAESVIQHAPPAFQQALLGYLDQPVAPEALVQSLQAAPRTGQSADIVLSDRFIKDLAAGKPEAALALGGLAQAADQLGLEGGTSLRSAALQVQASLEQHAAAFGQMRESSGLDGGVARPALLVPAGSGAAAGRPSLAPALSRSEIVDQAKAASYPSEKLRRSVLLLARAYAAGADKAELDAARAEALGAAPSPAERAALDTAFNSLLSGKHAPATKEAPQTQATPNDAAPAPAPGPTDWLTASKLYLERAVNPALVALGRVENPVSIADYPRLFGENGERLDAPERRAVLIALAREWGVGEDEVKSRVRAALDHIAERQDRRAGLSEMMGALFGGARMGPYLTTYVAHQHNAWLAKAFETDPKLVAMNQALFDALIWAAERKGILFTDSLGRRQRLTPEHLRDPAAKFKLMPADFVLQGNDRAQFESLFHTATGRTLEAFSINTLAAPYETLTGIGPTGVAGWTSRRESYLHGLQAEPLGALMVALDDPDLMRRLTDVRDPLDREQAGLDVLEIVSDWFQANARWGGFSDRLIRKKFDVAAQGGIGIGDILKDAASVNSALTTLSQAPEDARRPWQAAFHPLLRQTLASLTDAATLTAALDRRRRREPAPEPARMRELSAFKLLRFIPLDKALSESGLSGGQIAFARSNGARIQSAEDFLAHASDPELAGGYTLGTSDPIGIYRALAAVSHMQFWRVTYERLFNDTSKPRPINHLKRITNDRSGKRVVLFVPPGGRDKNPYTWAEIDVLLSRPAWLGRMTLVFGAYDLVDPFVFEKTLASLNVRQREAALEAVLRDPRAHAVGQTQPWTK